MAIVTGNVQSFGLQPLFDQMLELVFTPSGPTTSVGRLLVTEPIRVTPNAAGDFSVVLASTEPMMPLRWYTITANWLTGDNKPVGFDFVDFKLYVPAAGGVISDLLVVPTNPFMIWLGPNPPANPTDYTLWIDTDDAKLYRWVA